MWVFELCLGAAFAMALAVLVNEARKLTPGWLDGHDKARPRERLSSHELVAGFDGELEPLAHEAGDDALAWARASFGNSMADPLVRGERCAEVPRDARWPLFTLDDELEDTVPR